MNSNQEYLIRNVEYVVQWIKNLCAVYPVRDVVRSVSRIFSKICCQYSTLCSNKINGVTISVRIHYQTNSSNSATICRKMPYSLVIVMMGVVEYNHSN